MHLGFCFTYTFDFRVLVRFIVEILFQMINIRNDEIKHNSKSIKEMIKLLGRENQIIEYFSQRFILYWFSLLCSSKRFLNSFIDFALTILLGNLFHVLTTRFVKKLAYFDLFTVCLIIFRLWPLSLVLFEKLKVILLLLCHNNYLQS